MAIIGIDLLQINGNGIRFTVGFYGGETRFEEEPEAEFADLRNYY